MVNANKQSKYTVELTLGLRVHGKLNVCDLAERKECTLQDGDGDLLTEPT